MKVENINIQKCIKRSGFSLLEVLIALVLLSIGLLGLASLQITGLKNNQRAHHRSQATQLSYDIADRMRSNKVALNTYSTIDPSNAEAKLVCITIAGCSASEMAENDLYEWNVALVSTLPSSLGTISTLLPVGTYQITITWDDNRDGLIDGKDPVFQTSFQP